jgi:LysR family transcriptional activator of nhaA
VVDVLPKLVVQRVLQPALELKEPVRVVCHEGPFEQLLADLSTHTLDVVIAEAPVPTGARVRAFNHLLGETGVSFFARRDLAQAYKRGFPRSLDGAPLLLPLETSNLRRVLGQWLARHDLKPKVVAEFEDAALLQVFGAEGLGLFAAATAVEDAVMKQFGVEVVGRAPEVRERYFAISVERKLKNPAVLAITAAAREELFV